VTHEILQSIAESRNARMVKRAARSLAADFQDSLYTEVDEVCKAHGQRRPAGWLAELGAGVDPRSTSSRVRALVDHVESRGPTELPTEEEWFELAEAIKNDPRYDKEPISLDKSTYAQTSLAKLLYVQKRSVDAVIDANITPTPLSADEIKAFREWFDEKY
jgi:hypothetical protein